MKGIEDNYYRKTRDVEDKYVIDFLQDTYGDCAYNLLEVGSGMGRFAMKIKEQTNATISCVEKNAELGNITLEAGICTYIVDITEIKLDDNNFDVIHCSHLIEHLGFPQIVDTLDSLYKMLKPNGYLILRSPLPSNKFYFDIDHVRPYPPQAIMAYFNNKEQQRKSANPIDFKQLRLRKQAWIPFPYAISGLKYQINRLMMFLWTYVRFPQSSPNGYTLILKKYGI